MLEENTNMGGVSPEPKRYSAEDLTNLVSTPQSSPSFDVPSSTPTTSTPAISFSRMGNREQGRSREQVQATPEDMQGIREYMRLRKGAQFVDKDDDEVYDAFMNHKRFMNVNEVTTIGEMTWLSRASEEDKAIAGNAYDIYNSLSNVFVNDGVAGAFDGVVDYGRAIITSPSTYLGGVLGRLAVGSGAKAATQATTSAATRAAVKAAEAAAARQAASRGLTGQALSTVVQQAGNTVAREAATTASRSVMLKQIGVAGAFDASANTVQDYLYQSVMMDAGAQEEYSVLQSGIAAVGGVVGAGVAAAPYALRGVSGLSDAETNLAVSFGRAKEENLSRLKKEAEEGFSVIKTSIEDWIEATQRGDLAAGDSRDIQKKVIDTLIGPESPYNLFDMFARSRFIFDDGPDAAPKTRQIIQALEDLGDIPVKRELEELFQNNMGVSLNETLDIVQNSIREGAVNMNYISRGVSRISAARKASEEILGPDGLPMPKDEGNLTGKPLEPKTLQYAASLWRRSLVSHPATTMVNVQGWSIATGANTMAQLLHGGAVGTIGLMTRVASPISATAKNMSDEMLTKSARIFQAEAFQIKTLLDPITTRESFNALVDSMPTKYKTQMESAVFGGIDVTGPISFNLARGGKALRRGSRDPQVADLQKLLKVEETGRFDEATEEAVKALQKRMGLTETGNVGRQEWAALTAKPLVRGLERASNKLAVASAVKLQDTYTKANTFLYELNKLSLREHKMPLNQLLSSGKGAEISDEMYEKATRAAMERAFSEDLTRTPGILGGVYRFTEALSSAPGIGFFFPFGRFVNNNLHFLLQYNPLGLFPDLLRMKGQWREEEFWEQSFKRVVGLGALYYLAQHQRENREKGLSWDQVENQQGDVIRVTNIAPLSFYLLGGRIFDLIQSGEEIPDELLYDLRQQLGTDFISRGVTETTDSIEVAIGYMANMLSKGATKEDLKQVVLALGQSFAGVASGYTRPLEPINVMAGLAGGSNDRPDRRQLEGGDRIVSEITRYTDSLFAPFLKEDMGRGAPFAPSAQSIGSETPLYDPNPVARLTGSRRDLPLTNTQRMLSKVDLPEWRANERTGVPSYDALINERATRLLEPRAERLLKSTRWRDANNRVRRLMVNELLREVKKDTRDWAAGGRLSDRTLVEQRKWTSVNERLRSEAKANFNLSNVPDTQLSWRQIELMREWIKHYSNAISGSVGSTQ